MKEKLRLLIIEDEPAIVCGLVDVFSYHGYEVETAGDGSAGLAKALHQRYDLILLDIMLPQLDGFSVCREIRKISREQPIIMLTAKAAEEDILQGLTLGADDYIEKPFSVRELVLRVEAVLRRSAKWRTHQATLSVGGLEIDTRTLAAAHPTRPGRNESSLHFTRKEVDVLMYLKNHADRPVPRGELLAEVWGYSKTGRFETRTIDIHIAKIRRKIEADPEHPTLLVTIRGEGYQLLG